MIKKLTELIRSEDSYAAIETINQQGQPAEVAETYNKLIKHLYWEEKNVPAVVAIGRAGIQYALAAVNTESDPLKVKEIRHLARDIAYNLASFSWSGWDEPGFTIDNSDAVNGLDVAKCCSRLDISAGEDASTLFGSYWMLGAHLLAGAQSNEAKAAFDNAARSAEEAGTEGERLLAEGFSILTQIQSSGSTNILKGEVADVKTRLSPQKHGQAFISQIDTAEKVFDLDI